jgi:hypothetical protein
LVSTSASMNEASYYGSGAGMAKTSGRLDFCITTSAWRLLTNWVHVSRKVERGRP